MVIFKLKASSRDSVDILLLLLNYGPDLNARDTNLLTPVMLASCGHIEVLGKSLILKIQYL